MNENLRCVDRAVCRSLQTFDESTLCVVMGYAPTLLLVLFLEIFNESGDASTKGIRYTSKLPL